MCDEKPRDLHERSFEFAKRIVRLCMVLEGGTGVSRTMSNQLLISETSIGANIEEAHAGQSKADFTAKMYIACKEARETHYWLRLLAATEVIATEKISSIMDEANQLVAILTTIVKKSRNNA